MSTKKIIGMVMVLMIGVMIYFTFTTGWGMDLIAGQFEEPNIAENDGSSEDGALIDGDISDLDTEDEEIGDVDPGEAEQPEETQEESWRRELQELLAFEKTTDVNSAGEQIVMNYNSIYTLVNKERMLPADYEPRDLVVPAVPFPFTEDHPKKYLRKEAAEALEVLFEDSKNEGLKLFATSGYRSYATQKSIFQQRAAEKGKEEANRTSARPGQSEHQTGLAMDVTNAEVDFRLTEAFGETQEGLWLMDQAHHYGFSIRYPKEKEHITGYSYEPWHLRYVGKNLATHLYENRLTLEEYFEIEHGY
ncbi:peptidase M15B and M15C, D,D-carboxypeptidase VanY/endolysin [Alkaliphilus metalliredigens QYMF]|uniref:Peptidase M15B and M15C, D,D-carboxypeptidase VanY/endolysin n=1 Tax=Alkaliphilus metalliredigens (strain QYMF) TaxID=293826 RepID=A6TTD5_ALKMQ|nr:M15 family metallopeptidase [Alkaliphilus metalliredigens]ABR49453.1 peptidase M15B and M15C, D,D-carboxypeptidase VanY/endolysin [Alkaliphilus metalliredigens QYMF]